MTYPCKLAVIEGLVEGTQNRAVVAVDHLGRVLLGETWVPTLRSDETADDSDKNFRVASDNWEQVLWIWVEYTSTATAGARQLCLELQDYAGDVIAQWRPGVTQAASLTYYYCFAPSNADLTAVRDTDYVMTPIPPTIILPAYYYVRIYDNNAVDPAADDMIVQLMVARRTI